ncbi:hypothetical protein [Ensifer sp. SSB1]|jgi:predicted TIM-barrel fold metal-dependent hydrolase|uniref:hypothetical protein n=1 Tax=Ensifer sp. SSB1 TaxID=2795385 RepID=UPI001A42B618|nr:hypothetical protein [Ensifer sp. SSB1]MBK5567770.1 hypothetical protein [Ensifer sp. SSB1]
MNLKNLLRDVRGAIVQNPRERFSGSDRILFSAKSPFAPEKGPGYIRDTLKLLNSLDLPKEDMEKICLRNAENSL